jgi:hypothetical protein
VILCLVCINKAGAVILPEDRADVMYHLYDGGGVSVSGPAILARKGFGEKWSVSALYYVDSISSASVDVMSYASPYSDQRVETGIGLDLVQGDAQISTSVTNSTESDYMADTWSTDVSQEVFGGMTTINMGFTRGVDTVGKNDDPTFQQPADHWQYRLGMSQVISKTLLMNLNYEAISDTGFLNNPYRIVQVAGSTTPERYPQTRSSHAFGAKAIIYLKPRKSLNIGYRYFMDTWGIRAHTVELGTKRYLGANEQWLVDTHFRYYNQDGAVFYSSQFPSEQNYMASDKELSSFSDYSVGVKATYKLREGGLRLLDQATANVAYDFYLFSYRDYYGPGGQPYSFGAHVIQLFMVLRY